MGYEQLEEPLVVQPMSQSFSRSESYYWENIVVQVSLHLRTQHETGPILIHRSKTPSSDFQSIT